MRHPYLADDEEKLWVAENRLTAAEVMTLRSSPFQVIPAPGPDRWIYPRLAVIRKPATPGWTVPSSTPLNFFWGASASVALAFTPNTATWGAGKCFDSSDEIIVSAQGISGTTSLFVVLKEILVPGYSHDGVNAPLVWKNGHASDELSGVEDDADGFALYLKVYYNILKIR